MCTILVFCIFLGVLARTLPSILDYRDQRRRHRESIEVHRYDPVKNPATPEIHQIMLDLDRELLIEDDDLKTPLLPSPRAQEVIKYLSEVDLVSSKVIPMYTKRRRRG